MPFETAALLPLLTQGGFTLWLYRTPDPREQALTAGYFDAAAPRLTSGDVIILQASDAVALTTVRPGPTLPGGIVLDTAAAPFRTSRAAAQRVSVSQAASAVAMTVLLAPLAGGILSNGTVQASAAVAGPVAEVRFSIRDAVGATLRGPQAATVTAGTASASLPAPDAGSGYRLRVEAVGAHLVADTSPPFAVSLPYTLLTEAEGRLLTEAGDGMQIV